MLLLESGCDPREVGVVIVCGYVGVVSGNYFVWWFSAINFLLQTCRPSYLRHAAIGNFRWA